MTPPAGHRHRRSVAYAAGSEVTDAIDEAIDDGDAVWLESLGLLARGRAWPFVAEAVEAAREMKRSQRESDPSGGGDSPPDAAE